MNEIPFACNRKDLLRLASHFSHLEGFALFYSGGEFDSGTHSFLCLFPTAKISLRCQDSINPWHELEALIGSFDSLDNHLKWVGFLGYELGCYADPDITIAHNASVFPDAQFYSPQLVIKVDHRSNQAVMQLSTAPLLYPEMAPYCASLLDPQQLAQLMACGKQQALDIHISQISCSDTQKSYCEKISFIQEAILKGNIYQLNLAQEFKLDCEPFVAFELFKQMIELNPASFMAYINCGEYAILSTSPERFLKKQGDLLETRPIKGTAPRSNDAEQDLINYQQLLQNDKERAELLMITDLMRNDLGQVSHPGTVKVKELWKCEKFSNVFHLVSVIESQTCNHSPIAILKKCFPGGSITGCPKLSAMQIIAAIENRPRGIYTGSIGYFTGNGDFDFNIAIRTMVMKNHQEKQQLQFQLGAGIVIDSNPSKEFEETLHKGRSLFKVLGIVDSSQNFPFELV